MNDNRRKILIAKFIPTENEHLFFDGGCDLELIEIEKAYQNLPDKIAGLYVDYILKSIGHCNIADFKTWVSNQILFFDGILKDLD